ncbi:hypothetical protein ACIQUB_21975 [Rhizobium sp. NPDC090275]|uniref:hypothetical protein n=1 Tax=Rhizobium sp. NPDC090275 TaxID=3364498 RepID=UPI003839DFE7
MKHVLAASMASVFIGAALSGATAEPMSENSELLETIAREIVDCGELDGIDWIEVSAIFAIDDDGDVNSSYGFAYDHTGNAHAAAFLYDPVEREVKRYREWLRLKGDKGFVKMLVQFNRETRRVNADFEYDNPARWQVTPNNVDMITRELQPRLGSKPEH